MLLTLPPRLNIPDIRENESRLKKRIDGNDHKKIEQPRTKTGLKMEDFPLLLQDTKTLKLIQALSPALAYILVSRGPGGSVSVEVAREEQEKSQSKERERF